MSNLVVAAGNFVKCIDGVNTPKGIFLTEGQLYRIMNDWNRNGQYIRLKDDLNTECLFFPDRFKPLTVTEALSLERNSLDIKRSADMTQTNLFQNGDVVRIKKDAIDSHLFASCEEWKLFARTRLPKDTLLTVKKFDHRGKSYGNEDWFEEGQQVTYLYWFEDPDYNDTSIRPPLMFGIAERFLEVFNGDLAEQDSVADYVENKNWGIF